MGSSYMKNWLDGCSSKSNILSLETYISIQYWKSILHISIVRFNLIPYTSQRSKLNTVAPYQTFYLLYSFIIVINILHFILHMCVCVSRHFCVFVTIVTFNNQRKMPNQTKANDFKGVHHPNQTKPRKKRVRYNPIQN